MSPGKYGVTDQMVRPVLSVCIPTYNRCRYLQKTLAMLTAEQVFVSSDDVEIVISDNCSQDETCEVCKEFVAKFAPKIKYFRQPENTGDKNFAAVLHMASGEYAKLNHDKIFFIPGKLTEFVDYLKNGDHDNIILLTNGANRLSGICKCRNFDDILEAVSYNITWIGAYCFKTDLFKELPEPDRYADLNFSQIDILARLVAQGEKVTVYGAKIMEGLAVPTGDSHYVPQIFGHNYFRIMDEIYHQGLISAKVYEAHKKHTLLKYINKYHFAGRGLHFVKGGYFRFLLPIYGKKAYFWLDYTKCAVCSLLRCLVDIRKNKKSKTFSVYLFSKTVFTSKPEENGHV